MTWRRSRLPAVLALATWVVAGCGGGEKPASAPAGKTKKITIASTGDARADAKTYLAQLCPKPIGGEPDMRNRFGEFTERRAIPKSELLRRFEDSAKRADEILAGYNSARMQRRFQIVKALQALPPSALRARKAHFPNRPHRSRHQTR